MLKLFQSVGYVYNTASLGSQILNNAEQIIYFLCCQCGPWTTNTCVGFGSNALIHWTR